MQGTSIVKTAQQGSKLQYSGAGSLLYTTCGSAVPALLCTVHPAPIAAAATSPPGSFLITPYLAQQRQRDNPVNPPLKPSNHTSHIKQARVHDCKLRSPKSHAWSPSGPHPGQAILFSQQTCSAAGVRASHKRTPVTHRAGAPSRPLVLLVLLVPPTRTRWSSQMHWVP